MHIVSLAHRKPLARFIERTKNEWKLHWEIHGIIVSTGIAQMKAATLSEAYLITLNYSDCW